MNKKTIKALLVLMMSIITIITIPANTVIATQHLTEMEKEYGRVTYDMIIEAAQLSVLFYEVVKTNDVEALLIVSASLQEALNPHLTLVSPSRRFDQVYEYMDNAIIYSQNVTINLNSAIRQGDTRFLINADNDMATFGMNLMNAKNELDRLIAGDDPNLMDTASSEISSDIKVTLNGTPIQFEQPPVIENGRTLVPLRAIFEALDVNVEWDENTQTITAIKDDITISMQIDTKIMTRNNTDIELDASPTIVNGRTLVPARAIAESFNVDVKWDGNTQTVILSTTETSGVSTRGYTENPDIPDFGWINGLIPEDTKTDSTPIIYVYEQGLTLDAILQYISVLESDGWKAIDTDALLSQESSSYNSVTVSGFDTFHLSPSMYSNNQSDLVELFLFVKLDNDIITEELYIGIFYGPSVGLWFIDRR